MSNYQIELQKAIDLCAQYYSESQIDSMTELELQCEYGRILAAKLRKAEQLEYAQMMNDLDKYVTSQYKEQ